MIIVVKLLFVLVEFVELPAVSDNSKEFSKHGVSVEGGNVPDPKLIMVD